VGGQGGDASLGVVWSMEPARPGARAVFSCVAPAIHAVFWLDGPAGDLLTTLLILSASLLARR
jgi:hypothetical protein